MIVREARLRANWLAEGDPLRSRLGIVAQAIGVAALAVVVYLAFLSPNDSGPLSGIDVQPPIEEPPERHASKQKKSKPKPDRPRRRAAVRVPASAPVAPSVFVPPADTPVGDQYTGSVARILARVSGAAH
jgi:hypothetical protein